MIRPDLDPLVKVGIYHAQRRCRNSLDGKSNMSINVDDTIPARQQCRRRGRKFVLVPTQRVVDLHQLACQIAQMFNGCCCGMVRIIVSRVAHCSASTTGKRYIRSCGWCRHASFQNDLLQFQKPILFLPQLLLFTGFCRGSVLVAGGSITIKRDR